MIVKKLGRQLKREILANKGKAATLALVTLVALYYWAPLLSGLVSSGDSEAPPVPGPARPAVTAAVPSPVQTATVQQADLPPWRELARWMQDDPQMHSAELPPGADPFRALSGHEQAQEVASTSALEEEENKGAVEVTPAVLGMQLTSTLVGPVRSIIQINGKTYVVARHPAAAGTATSKATSRIIFETEGRSYLFDIVSVQPGRVVLRDGDRRFVLSVKQPALAENENILFYSENN